MLSSESADFKETGANELGGQSEFYAKPLILWVVNCLISNSFIDNHQFSPGQNEIWNPNAFKNLFEFYSFQQISMYQRFLLR